jgi:hypothetical protein
MSKLSKAQRDVLAKMADGWKLERAVCSWYIFKPGDSFGDVVNKKTGNALLKYSYIALSGSGDKRDVFTLYALTDKGREALAE